MFSIVATETSVLTFVSIPGLAYRSDWFFLQLAMGYIAGRMLVSVFLLPLYFKGDVTSIYEIIGNRFGPVVQRAASGIFLITRLLSDGIRFLATAVVVQMVTGWPIWAAVIVIGLVTMIYTLAGGIRTVLWVDSFQFLLYLIGGTIVILFILSSQQFIGWDILIDQGKMQIFRFHTESMFKDAWFIGSAFFGGTLLSFASHGADYMMVQRVLTCRDLPSARWAMIGSGFFVFLQFAIFLLAGSLIFVYMGGAELSKDRELSTFIVNHLPIGIRGILLAGVLSAAMSTLSSSINSLASSTIHDWMKTKASLFQSMFISGIWASILILIALIFDEGDTAVVVLGLKIASFTYGGLLSLFILSRSKKSFKTPVLIIGLFVSLGSVFILQELDVAWTWFIGIAVIMNLIIVYGLHFLGFKKGLYLLLVIGGLWLFKSIGFGYKSGLDVLVEEDFIRFNGKSVGVVVNHTSLNQDGEHLIKLAHSSGIKIASVFSPEHGFKGVVEAGETFADGIEPLTGSPIYSLYGSTRKPTREMLSGLDALVFDMQDIGVRYYTYVSTLTLIMEAAAENGIPIWILDRLNPMDNDIRGPVLDLKFSSFVGMHPIPIRHGMTIGQLARMINEEGWLENGNYADLKVIKYQGKPDKGDSEAAFNPSPSPNMPDLETAWNYQGLCLLEGTNISEGRGTHSPFKLIGAPWIESENLLHVLLPLLHKNDKVDTVSFIPRSIPGKSAYPKYENEICHGIKIQFLASPIIWTVQLLQVLDLIYPDNFQFLQTNFIDNLYGTDELRLTINEKDDVNKLITGWKEAEEKFRKVKTAYSLY